MMKFKATWLALAAGLAVAACGGGGADTTPQAKVSAVKVFGDSLADVGTFGGVRATVQGTGILMYPELVAAAYSVPMCNFFVYNGSTFVTKSGCTNYAIGGGLINHANAADPRGIPLQLATAATVGFSADDLLVVDGGGNDTADLVQVYLAASTDGGVSLAAKLTTLLPAATVSAALAGGATTTAAIGATYMQAVADKLAAAIKSSALDKGVQRVVVLNMPAILNTPRFLAVLQGISAATAAAAKAKGASDADAATAGATAKAQAQAVFNSWMVAYNAELDSKFAGESRVVVADFYKAFNDQVAMPAQFGLTNVTTPACPATGVGSDGLPTYTFATCTATALSATPPTGVTDPNWWKTYGFSDGFHPTPAAHQLIYQLLSRSLANKGWL
jgi:outer membrane lipase/esterase